MPHYWYLFYGDGEKGSKMNCDMQVKTEGTSLGTLRWKRTSNWRKEYEGREI